MQSTDNTGDRPKALTLKALLGLTLAAAIYCAVLGPQLRNRPARDQAIIAACALVMLVLTVAFMFIGARKLGKTRQLAGALVFKITSREWPLRIVAAYLVCYTAYTTTNGWLRFSHTGRALWPMLIASCSQAFMVAFFLTWLLIGSPYRLEFRRNGLAFGYILILWTDIRSYTWPAKNILALQLARSVQNVGIPARYRDEVEKILAEHIGKGAPAREKIAAR